MDRGIGVGWICAAAAVFGAAGAVAAGCGSHPSQGDDAPQEEHAGQPRAEEGAGGDGEAPLAAAEEAAAEQAAAEAAAEEAAAEEAAAQASGEEAAAQASGEEASAEEAAAQASGDEAAAGAAEDGVAEVGEGRDEEEARLDLGALAGAAGWRLFAVEMARSEGVPARRLIHEAPPEQRVEMSFYFFVVVGNGRVVLVDTGTDAFTDGERGQALRRRWSVTAAVGIEQALARVGLAPAEVTDVVLTHHHWDHVGGLPRLPRATVHAHRGEWERVPERIREPVERQERAETFGGVERTLWPGLSVRRAGRHTANHLMVRVRCGARTWVLAGDAAYLFSNIERGVAVAESASPAGNVADVAAVVREVGAGRVLPGHDPALFERFSSRVDGVAAICP